MKSKDMAGIRREYHSPPLNEAEMFSDPYDQFDQWFSIALDTPKIMDPTAAALATADKQANPSVRIVLIKGVTHRGFTLFTNYESQKSKDLFENPFASLLFFWDVLHQQIRIEGTVSALSRTDSELYFHSRPFESQIMAHVSEQSQIIENRIELDSQFEKLCQRYRGLEVPLPENWGGFLLEPSYFEFWQGQPNRLHDRIFYRRKATDWERGRLAP